MLTLNPAAALLLAHQLRTVEQAWPACPHGDPYCPCQDGDSCHYEWSGDTPPLPCQHCGTN